MGMRLAEGSITLRTPLLLLGLWVVLAPAQCSQGRPSWRYISSEVVVPRKELHHGKGIQSAGWLSYSVSFGGQRHLIHMRRKRLFWPRDVVLMTQDDQGALQVDYPFFPLDCYYLGYLEDVPLSMVTVDTCYGGLEGIMKLDDLAYEIRPLKDSPRFEHVVSQIIADTTAIGPMSMLGHKEERDPLFSRANASAASRISSKLYASHHGNMKGCLMSAHSLYTLYQNVSLCAQFLVRLGSIIDSLFRGLDIRYYIGLMVIYNAGEPTAMDNFQVPRGPFARHYFNNIFKPFAPHSGLIMTRNIPHELNFTPLLYTLCEGRGLTFLAELSRHYLLLSIIATHQLAVLIGLYMDTPNCVCQRRTTCIMNRYPVLTDSFSNCSFLHLQNVLANPVGAARCLFSTEEVHSNRSLTVTRCGNSVVEGKEQCDCGSFKQCYSDPCCNNDCSFTPQSVCDSDRCCTRCSYANAGLLCRPIQNICDLPEYCTGSTAKCPADFYLQDGTPCTEDGYCYNGNCTDRSVHCKEIFGEGAQNAPDICYDINKEGHRFGHCAVTLIPIPKACSGVNAKCGRLQCVNVTHLPRLQEHVGFHHSVIEGHLCFGVGAHRGTETTDVGAVRPGTPCGSGKFCLDTHCNGTVAAINYDCSPSKCNYRGICNNRGNCHCHVGFEPPQCINHGAGGSVDSGPTPGRMRSVRLSDMSVVHLRVVFARILAIIAALLFGVATNVRIAQTTVVTEVRASEK